ncbi:MAG: hypothetical protein HQL80_11405, partial [Magnetococcales bacterium]|nr:hypothetical protein [Magnetococcales bacterium]
EQYPKITVVMVSGASHANADIVVECLNSGAFDFVTKPLESDIDHSKGALSASLKPILTLLARRGKYARPASSPVRVQAPQSSPGVDGDGTVVASRESGRPSSFVGGRGLAGSSAGVKAPVSSYASGRAGGVRSGDRPSGPVWESKPALLLIGSSTGGPAALTQLLSGISPGLGIPAMIVQHMPPMFTLSLAAQLTRATGHVVQEAEHNRMLEAGRIFLAPGGRHLSVKKQGDGLRTVLNDGPKVNGCRPSVDVLFMSVLASFSEPVLAVILTGMGNDGANGVKGLKRSGRTYCITQSKESCVVYGMPRVVEEMGLSDASLTLEQMGARITELCRS